MIKIIAPGSSHFQAIIKKAVRANDGIRFMKNEPSCCQIVRPGANESNANRLTKRIAKIQTILGNQCNILIFVSIMLQFSMVGFINGSRIRMYLRRTARKAGILAFP